MSADDVRTLADGRTYTAQQALDNGLIDEIGSFEYMQEQMMSETGVYTVYEPTTEESMLSALFSELECMIPKSEAQILKETAEEMESGVLMYYAEQLQ